MKILKYAGRTLGIAWIEVCKAAIEVCGKGKRGFTKKRDEWWDDEVQDAIERKKKAWQDYKASGKNKNMTEIKKKAYKLQKHQTKVLIEKDTKS